MLARLLHGALALSIASEPAAEDDGEAAPAASASPATAEGDEAEEPAPAEEPTEAQPPDDAPPAAPEEPDAAPPPAEEPDAAQPSSDARETGPQDDAPPEPTPSPEPVATQPPRPIAGPPPSGRNDDIVGKALLGGGIASLTLTAGLIGTSAWAWTEHNRAKRAAPNLTGDAQLEARDRRDQMRTIGLITTGAAALYGTTGVVLLLLRARDRKPPRTVLAPTPGGLSLTGRF